MNTIRKTVVMVATLAAMIPMGPAFAAGDSQAALQAQAKVTEAEATATALAKVPHGTVKSAELEREHGKLVWSFDVASPSTRGVTEIQVDAITGKIVSVKKETPSQEAREKRAEAKEAR
ncbi:MAG: peptidase [Ramlibacter sp.]|nr:peptidase [Ramlibacter sp.]